MNSDPTDNLRPVQLGAIAAISSERLRQVTEEGFDLAHDATHSPGTLLAAAACYLNHAGLQLEGLDYSRRPPQHWPWSEGWWKPAADADRNLIKGGALVMAALDRLYEQEEGTAPAPPPVRPRATDDEIKAWADRNGIEGGPQTLRVVFEDATTLHLLRKSCIRTGPELEAAVDRFVDSHTPEGMAAKMVEYGARSTGVTHLGMAKPPILPMP